MADITKNEVLEYHKNAIADVKKKWAEYENAANAYLEQQRENIRKTKKSLSANAPEPLHTETKKPNIMSAGERARKAFIDKAKSQLKEISETEAQKTPEATTLSDFFTSDLQEKQEDLQEKIDRLSKIQQEADTVRQNSLAAAKEAAKAALSDETRPPNALEIYTDAHDFARNNVFKSFKDNEYPYIEPSGSVLKDNARVSSLLDLAVHVNDKSFARRAFDLARSIQPKNPDICYIRGVWELQQANENEIGKEVFFGNRGDRRIVGTEIYDFALRNFERAVELSGGKHSKAQQALAEVYLLKGTDYDKYLSDVQRDHALEANPYDVPALIAKGDLYASQSDNSLALETYEKALEVDPKNFTALHKHAGVCSKLGLHDEAQRDYSECIKIQPKNSLLYVERGNSYQNSGKDELAVNDYKEYLRRNPVKQGDIPSATYISVDKKCKGLLQKLKVQDSVSAIQSTMDSLSAMTGTTTKHQPKAIKIVKETPVQTSSIPLKDIAKRGKATETSKYQVKSLLKIVKERKSDLKTTDIKESSSERSTAPNSAQAYETKRENIGFSGLESSCAGTKKSTKLAKLAAQRSKSKAAVNRSKSTANKPVGAAKKSIR